MVLYEVREDVDKGRYMVALRSLGKGVKILREAGEVFLNESLGEEWQRCWQCAVCGNIFGNVIDMAPGLGVGGKKVAEAFTRCRERMGGSLEVTPIHCRPGCIDDADHVYCSERCFHTAQGTIPCTGHLTSEAADAYKSYKDLFTTNKRFMLLLKHLYSRSEGDIERVLAEYDDGGMNMAVDKGVRCVIRRANELIERIIGRQVGAQVLLQLLNVYNVNIHTTCTLSPAYLLLRHCKALSGITPHMPPPPPFLHSWGTGLFSDAACMNHSCVPTCKVTPAPHTTTIDVHTIVPVKAHEELTISYIDAMTLKDKPVTRRRQLDPYNFICACSLCSFQWDCINSIVVASALSAVAGSSLTF
eukprot:TRINITY_DN27350_c0_g1_i1.p1 TRINITY_DN27350_c0_g1~~TRINITY_DN27350_c0_g1_i1.p1  ORF type:complete len:359 (+),score=36.91 TRINITY_DN27350_c0_g1_i1:35-1111(+)